MGIVCFIVKRKEDNLNAAGIELKFLKKIIALRILNKKIYKPYHRNLVILWKDPRVKWAIQE